MKSVMTLLLATLFLLAHLSLVSAAFVPERKSIPTPRFFASSRSSAPSHTALYGYSEGSEAVKVALEASKKYGLTSREAQLAWDVVGGMADEMDGETSDDEEYRLVIEPLRSEGDKAQG